LRGATPAILALLSLFAAPHRARAEAHVYCAGRVVVERFVVLGTPGPQGRSHYSAHLRNTRGVPQNLVVVMAGDALGRPMGQRLTLPGHGRMVLPLGYHPRQPGRPALTPQRLAEATRISCP
jgi:hypothetical protein